MDTELLSRIQFGFTVGFHILFPTLTIGLSLFLLLWAAGVVAVAIVSYGLRSLFGL
jgi:cytochrome bd-type quinol oxidase subunit 1